MASVIADGWHYIRNGDGSEELYDFSNDPLATRDRSTDSTVVGTLIRLRQLASGHETSFGSDSSRID